MRYSNFIFSIFLLFPLVSFSEGEAFYVSIVSSGSNFDYKVKINNKILVVEPWTSEVTKSSRFYWDDFLNVNSVLSNEDSKKTASKLNGALKYCEQYVSSANSLFGVKNVFGDTSPDYSGKNISVSPNRQYAIVKSSVGPYLLLDLNKMEFEDFCVENGRDVSWKEGEVIAISYKNDDGSSVRVRDADSIVIYNLLNGDKRHLFYSGKFVQDIAWLNGTDLLSVLVSEKSGNNNPLNVFDHIYRLLGHPVEYQKFGVEMVSYESGFRVHEILEGAVKNGYSYINYSQ